MKTTPYEHLFFRVCRSVQIDTEHISAWDMRIVTDAINIKLREAWGWAAWRDLMTFREFVPNAELPQEVIEGELISVTDKDPRMGVPYKTFWFHRTDVFPPALSPYVGKAVWLAWIPAAPVFEAVKGAQGDVPDFLCPFIELGAVASILRGKGNFNDAWKAEQAAAPLIANAALRHADPPRARR